MREGGVGANPSNPANQKQIKASSPNSVWERQCLRNFVAPVRGMRLFGVLFGNGVSKTKVRSQTEFRNEDMVATFSDLFIRV